MQNLETQKAEFDKFVSNIKTQKFYKEPLAWAFGRLNKSMLDYSKTLSADYAVINYKQNFKVVAVLLWALNECGKKVDLESSEAVIELDKEVVAKTLSKFEFLKDEVQKHRNLANLLMINEIFTNPEFSKENKFCVTFIFEDREPKSVECVYLKLYLLWLKKVNFGDLNFEGALEILPNVAWDEFAKPVELEWLRQSEIFFKMTGSYPVISSVGKFPRFLNHIIPDDDVMITDASKIIMNFANDNSNLK